MRNRSGEKRDWSYAGSGKKYQRIKKSLLDARVLPESAAC